MFLHDACERVWAMLSWSDIYNLLSTYDMPYMELPVHIRSQLYEYDTMTENEPCITLDIAERNVNATSSASTGNMAQLFADVVNVGINKDNIYGITLYAHQLYDNMENKSLRCALFHPGVEHITLVIPICSCIPSYEQEWTQYYETLCYDISSYLQKIGNRNSLQHRITNITLRFTDELESNTLPSGEIVSSTEKQNDTPKWNYVCPSDVNIVLKTYFERHFPELDELHLTWFIAMYLIQSTPRSICYTVEHPFRALPIFMYKRFPFCVQRYMDQTDRCIVYGDIPPSPDMFHVGLIDRILERCKVE